MPPLLETYEEARMLLEAKGWGVSAAAEHLAEMPGLASFNISQATLSRKTTPGSKFPIEPEVAAAVEALETRVGYERQTEIVTKGLLALHGDPPLVDIDRLARDLREHLPTSELILKLVAALEEKASARATRRLFERLSRPSWKQIAISAGSGALVALLLVPLLSAAHAFPTGSLAVMVPAIAADYSSKWLRFEPGSVLARSEWGEKVPAEQYVPRSTLPGQAVAPCDAEAGEVAIYGNCWFGSSEVKPPCGSRGVLFRHGDKCYRAVAAEPKKPVVPAP
ncbi:MAG TPA: hypothetical protein VIG99_30265 [Myxococcaceae bacterium]